MLPNLPICPSVTWLMSLLNTLLLVFAADQFCHPSHSTIILNVNALTSFPRRAAPFIHNLLQKRNP